MSDLTTWTMFDWTTFVGQWWHIGRLAVKQRHDIATGERQWREVQDMLERMRRRREA